MIGGNGDSIYKRLMKTIDREDLTGPRFEHNIQRVKRQKQIEDAIIAWTSVRSIEEVLAKMNKAGVPVGRVVTVKEVVENDQLISRGTIQVVDVETEDKEGIEREWTVKMPGTFPVIDGVSSKPKWAGPQLGAHTDEVLKAELGLGDHEIARLRRERIIG